MRIMLCLALAAVIHRSHAVSTKMDFGEPPPSYFSEEPTFVVSNSSVSPANTNDEDVEVEHTIVVSTKLKNNNNKRGFTSNGDTDGTLTYNIGQRKNKKEDDEEVPVIKSYKSVDTTDIKSPDTRYKTKIYPDSIFVNRNIRDEGDIFPNVAVYPLNWKPAGFYHNINYRSQDDSRDPYSMSRRRKPNQANINRKVSEEGQREFYCKKCAELSRAQGFRGCGVQQRSASASNFNPNGQFKPNVLNFQPTVGWYEMTTQKMKIDGKLAKLN